MTAVAGPVTLGSGMHNYNAPASYTVDGTIYSYSGNNSLVHLLVTMYRTNSDSSIPPVPTVTHSGTGMTYLVQTIIIPTNNKFRIVLHVFKNTTGSTISGTFTISGIPGNSVIARSYNIYAQYARATNPIRTWSTANTTPSNGADGGPYGSLTSTTAPTQGVQGPNVVPSTSSTRNLVVAISVAPPSGAMALNTGHTGLSSDAYGQNSAHFVAGYTSAAGGAYAGSVTHSGGSQPVFAQLASFEIANDTYADTLYIPATTPTTLSGESSAISDSNMAAFPGFYFDQPAEGFSIAESSSPSIASIEPSYNVYRDGVLVGTTSFYETSFVDAAPDGIHTYTVTAVDAFTNESEPSSPGSLIDVDTTPPPVPTNVTSSLEEDTVVLTWTG